MWRINIDTIFFCKISVTFSSIILIQIQWRRSRKKTKHAIWGLSGWLVWPLLSLVTLTTGHLILQSALKKGYFYESNTVKHHMRHSDMVQWHCWCACFCSFVNFSVWWSVNMRSSVLWRLIWSVKCLLMIVWEIWCLPIIRDKQSGGCTLKFW